MKEIFCISLLVLFLTGCSVQKKYANPFKMPDELYSIPDYGNDDAAVLHPAGFVQRLAVKPTNECEREALRKLVIAMNMYAREFHNQSYYIEVDSTGVKILMEAFPSLNSLSVDERGTVIYLGKVSHHLRTLKIDC